MQQLNVMSKFPFFDHPQIKVGGIYLNDFVNEYLIVTKTNQGQIFYSGHGFTGQANDEVFLERFLPVDPADVHPDELNELLTFCPSGTEPLTGYVS